jgi:hypothetical protein
MQVVHTNTPVSVPIGVYSACADSAFMLYKYGLPSVRW